MIDVLARALFYSYLYGIETTFVRDWFCFCSGFTRTFMELKHVRQARTGPGCDVLLVPLWNWNDYCPESVLLLASFTRTFMELKLLTCYNTILPFLKFYSYLYGIETSIRNGGFHLLKGFTRTFMELKLPFPATSQDWRKVLLVPLWNWNFTALPSTILTIYCFTRTFMELKPDRNQKRWIYNSFTRTFMELKLW